MLCMKGNSDGRGLADAGRSGASGDGQARARSARRRGVIAATGSGRQRRRPCRRRAPGMRGDRGAEEALGQAVAQLGAQRRDLVGRRKRQRVLMQMAERAVLEQRVRLIDRAAGGCVVAGALDRRHGGRCVGIVSGRRDGGRTRSQPIEAGTADGGPGHDVLVERARRHRHRRQQRRQPEGQDDHPAGERSAGGEAHGGAF
ncbi:hypothetical protein Ddc_22906 [Ditylenchus destructor]|nr:hypothetical protein Ddc_22906 [Ditylenchus destructor]